MGDSNGVAIMQYCNQGTPAGSERWSDASGSQESSAVHGYEWFQVQW